MLIWSVRFERRLSGASSDTSLLFHYKRLPDVLAENGSMEASHHGTDPRGFLSVTMGFLWQLK